MACSRAPATLDESTDRVALGFAGGGCTRPWRPRASVASVGETSSKPLGSTARSLRGHRSPLGRDRARRRVGGEMFARGARGKSATVASGGTRTAAPVVTPVVAAAVPAATTARGAVTRVRGDVRGLRAARVRGGNRASARVSGSGRAAAGKNAALHRRPMPRPRRVARAVSRGRTSGFRRREEDTHPEGAGAAPPPPLPPPPPPPGGGGGRSPVSSAQDMVVGGGA